MPRAFPARRAMVYEETARNSACNTRDAGYRARQLFIYSFCRGYFEFPDAFHSPPPLFEMTRLLASAGDAGIVRRHRRGVSPPSRRPAWSQRRPPPPFIGRMPATMPRSVTRACRLARHH